MIIAIVSYRARQNGLTEKQKKGEKKWMQLKHMTSKRET